MTDTSEHHYGLPKQPKKTCPIVNDGLDALKKLVYNQPRAREIERGEEDGLRDMLERVCSDLDYYVPDVENALESCRQQAIDLREWGQSWKDLAKENLEKVELVDSPWAGIMLWWHERGEEKWRITWVYRTCFKPYPRVHKPIII